MTPTRSKAEHKQAPIMYEGEVIFSVDKKLQKLIQFFVDNGIETFNSCEDRGAFSQDTQAASWLLAGNDQVS